MKVSKNLKYLGVVFSEKLDSVENQKDRREAELKQKQVGWILKSSSFDGAASFHLFLTLFRSKLKFACCF